MRAITTPLRTSAAGTVTMRFVAFALTQPVLWLAAGGALVVVAAWALMMRRYISEVYFR